MRFLLLFLIASLLPLHSPTAKDSENKTETESIILQREEIIHYNLIPTDFAFTDDRRIKELMDMLEKQVAVPAANATFDKNLKITAGRPGKALDRRAFQIKLLEAYYDEEIEQFEVPLKEVEPRVDESLLQSITVNKLGTYTTHYNPNNKERSKNVKLAAEAINGTTIFPGETFSFNKTVGERTEERGYERAPVIVKGEFAEDIGGGICQVSSTLFNTVDLRGIQMIERYTHSRPVPYVPPGRDATVSWWGPDFTFKNLYNEPVVIKAKAANGNLVIELLSSETVENFNPDE